MKKTRKPQERTERIKTKDYFDRVLPGYIKFNVDHYIVGDSYRSVWAIREYPPVTEEQAILSRLADKNGVTLRIYNRLVEAAEQRKIIQNAARKNKMKSQRSTLSFDQRKTELAKFFPESIFPVIQSFSFFSTEEIFFQSSVKLKGIKSCDISFNK